MSYRKLSAVLVVFFSVCSLSGCGSGSGSGEPAAATGSAPVVGGIPAETDGNGTDAGSAGTGSAVLSWDAPTTNVDQTPLSDLSGYKVYYGTAPGNYTASLSVGQVSDFSVKGLAPGTYYFAVTAFNAEGVESDYSNEITKKIL